MNRHMHHGKADGECGALVSGSACGAKYDDPRHFHDNDHPHLPKIGAKGGECQWPLVEDPGMFCAADPVDGRHNLVDALVLKRQVRPPDEDMVRDLRVGPGEAAQMLEEAAELASRVSGAVTARAARGIAEAVARPVWREAAEALTREDWVPSGPWCVRQWVVYTVADMEPVFDMLWSLVSVGADYTLTSFSRPTVGGQVVMLTWGELNGLSAEVCADEIVSQYG